MKMMGNTLTSKRHQTFASKDPKNKIEATTLLSPQRPGVRNRRSTRLPASPLASAALTTGQAVYTGSGRPTDGGVVSLDDFGLQCLPDGFSKAIRQGLKRKLGS